MAKDADRELRQATFASLRMVMKSIVELLGPACEVVLHDMSDPDSSIVAIEGDVTGRCVGGPLTDSGLGCLRSADKGRVYKYTTVAEGGRVIKSASVFLSDDQGGIFGGLCINLDITPYVAFDHSLQTLLQPAKHDRSAYTFTAQVEEALDTMVTESLAVFLRASASSCAAP